MFSFQIDPLIVKMLLAFSAYTNAKKVFHMTTNSGDQLQCIHAIRTLSFGWVVLGHTFVFGLGAISQFDYLLRARFFSQIQKKIYQKNRQYSSCSN